jgi:small conductance mechanosensitive channel
VVWASVLLIVLHDFGLEIGPLLAGLGIAGAALGFGAQYLVQDWIAGFFNVVENNYAVGDLIEAGTMRGTVERITMRTTHLRALGGEVHIIQNGTIRALTNFTRQWGRAILDVGVDYRSDMGAVFDALDEVGRRAAADPVTGPAFIEPSEVLGVTQLGESQITVRLWAKTDPQRKWEVERHLRRLAVEVFAERGISIPFPHRTVEIAGLPVDLAARPTPGKEGDA